MIALETSEFLKKNIWFIDEQLVISLWTTDDFPMNKLMISLRKADDFSRENWWFPDEKLMIPDEQTYDFLVKLMISCWKTYDFLMSTPRRGAAPPSWGAAPQEGVQNHPKSFQIDENPPKSMKTDAPGSNIYFPGSWGRCFCPPGANTGVKNRVSPSLLSPSGGFYGIVVVSLKTVF